jgi:hypothetical protein
VQEALHRALPRNWFSNQSWGVTAAGATPARNCCATASKAWAKVCPEAGSRIMVGAEL